MLRICRAHRQDGRPLGAALSAAVRDWLQEQGFHPGALSPQTRWNEDLGLTSLEAVELLVELEDRLGLSIPDADAKRMITIQDLLDHVTSTVGPRLETRQKHAKPLAPPPPHASE